MVNREFRIDWRLQCMLEYSHNNTSFDDECGENTGKRRSYPIWLDPLSRLGTDVDTRGQSEVKASWVETAIFSRPRLGANCGLVEMSSGTVVQRNIIANVIGGSWVVLLNLLVIPFQIRILGAEAYGLIGFMVSLQILLTVLDLGLSKTLNREIASDTTEARKFSRALVQTATAIYLGITILISVGLLFSADWLVSRWLRLETISISEAASAIRILAVWVVFYWPATLYNSILTGLQRLDVVNVVRVLTVTLVQGGGIVILLVHGGL